jgi:hypothetical protein
VRPGFARLLFITAFSTASSLMFNASELVNTPTKSPPRCPALPGGFSLFSADFLAFSGGQELLFLITPNLSEPADGYRIVTSETRGSP